MEKNKMLMRVTLIENEDNEKELVVEVNTPEPSDTLWLFKEYAKSIIDNTTCSFEKLIEILKLTKEIEESEQEKKVYKKDTCNFREELDPFFKKFTPLQKNFCAKCLDLKKVQPNEDELSKKTCDVYLMDTGVCSMCGEFNDVLNPFIYATAKLNKLNIDIADFERIYRSEIKGK